MYGTTMSWGHDLLNDGHHKLWHSFYFKIQIDLPVGARRCCYNLELKPNLLLFISLQCSVFCNPPNSKISVNLKCSPTPRPSCDVLDKAISLRVITQMPNQRFDRLDGIGFILFTTFSRYWFDYRRNLNQP